MSTHQTDPMRTLESEGLDQDQDKTKPQTLEQRGRNDRLRIANKRLLDELRGDDLDSAEEPDIATALLAAGSVPTGRHRTEPAADGGEDEAVTYLRVSTKDQAKRGGNAEGFSIPAQREACDRKASSLRVTVVEEFIEPGESAKTADRPELQRLLKYIKANKRVRYVIVHKLDRLARNREDDIAITVALKRAGVTLVSCTENIDETPSGALLHGIMSSIAEFYSRNLAAEVIKGSTEKAKNGGTPYQAPIGYLNVPYPNPHGKKDIRAVEVDPEREPLVVWCFEQYATGLWTTLQLLEAVTERGLRTKPTAKRPSQPMSHNGFCMMLKNPYYMGIVPYRGVHYEGKHTALVSPELWLRVQDVLAAHDHAGEKTRRHPHYLKGSIFCARCGSRVCFSRNKGNGGTYDYFFCIGRQRYGKDCTFGWVKVATVETAVEEFYERFQLSPERVEAIKDVVISELAVDIKAAEQQGKQQERIIARLEAERKKLLKAHYDDAIPVDLLKEEQQRITRELAEANAQLAVCETHFQDVEQVLERGLELAGSCQAQYQAAPSAIRRQFNQGFFEAIYIDEQGQVERAELSKPFAALLADDLTERIEAEQAARATHQDTQVSDWDLATVRDLPEEDERPGSGDGTSLLVGVGLKETTVAPPTGFEPVSPP